MEKIMQKTNTSVAIGGWPLRNLRLDDDIDLLVDSKEELQQLAERLEKTAAGYNGMENSSDYNKIHVNSSK